MCCFSRHVASVWNTRIFARRIAPAHQALAYAMGASIGESMAMVLPLPVPPGSADEAVRFVDLHGGGKDYFFGYLDACFPIAAGALAQPASRGSKARPLEVHAVGLFEASFVPSRRDFARLDVSFSMPESLWSSVAAYDDWGFAVFQLAPSPRSGLLPLSAPKADFHPMAFVFPTREPARSSSRRSTSTTAPCAITRCSTTSCTRRARRWPGGSDRSARRTPTTWR